MCRGPHLDILLTGKVLLTIHGIIVVEESPLFCTASIMQLDATLFRRSPAKSTVPTSVGRPLRHRVLGGGAVFAEAEWHQDLESP